MASVAGAPGEGPAGAAVAVVVDDELALPPSASCSDSMRGPTARKGRRQTVILKRRSSWARMGASGGTAS